MQGAAAKDSSKMNAPAPKSDAASAEQTTNPSTGAAQYSKEKQILLTSKEENAYPDYRPHENFSD